MINGLSICSTQEEEAQKETGEHKNIVDVSLVTPVKSIESELLLPLDTETKYSQAISSNNPTKTKSDVSARKSLNVSENKKAPNKKMLKEERNNKNSNSSSKEGSTSSSHNQKEQNVSSGNASKGQPVKNSPIILFEVTDISGCTFKTVILYYGKY
jgi:hypothetical protein